MHKKEAVFREAFADIIKLCYIVDVQIVMKCYFSSVLYSFTFNRDANWIYVLMSKIIFLISNLFKKIATF